MKSENNIPNPIRKGWKNPLKKWVKPAEVYEKEIYLNLIVYYLIIGYGKLIQEVKKTEIPVIEESLAGPIEVVQSARQIVTPLQEVDEDPINDPIGDLTESSLKDLRKELDLNPDILETIVNSGVGRKRAIGGLRNIVKNFIEPNTLQKDILSKYNIDPLNKNGSFLGFYNLVKLLKKSKASDPDLKVMSGRYFPILKTFFADIIEPKDVPKVEKPKANPESPSKTVNKIPKAKTKRKVKLKINNLLPKPSNKPTPPPPPPKPVPTNKKHDPKVPVKIPTKTRKVRLDGTNIKLDPSKVTEVVPTFKPLEYAKKQVVAVNYICGHCDSITSVSGIKDPHKDIYVSCSNCRLSDKMSISE